MRWSGSRDVVFLVDQKVINDSAVRLSLELPSDMESAEALAGRARAHMGLPAGPLLDLQRAAERVGLLAFSQDLGETGGDAAYVEVASRGVALINGHAEPGRRRFNLAHELGHHLFGDAYAPGVAISASDETERLINAFAVHLLLPRREVTEAWNAVGEMDRRLAAISVSFTFRASWSATCNQLRTLGLIEERRCRERPRRAHRQGRPL